MENVFDRHRNSKEIWAFLAAGSLVTVAVVLIQYLLSISPVEYEIPGVSAAAIGAIVGFLYARRVRDRS